MDSGSVTHYISCILYVEGSCFACIHNAATNRQAMRANTGPMCNPRDTQCPCAAEEMQGEVCSNTSRRRQEHRCKIRNKITNGFDMTENIYFE